MARLALVVLALSVTLPACSSSIVQAQVGARLESGVVSGDSSLLSRACSAITSAVSSGLPRVTNSRVLLADAAVSLSRDSLYFRTLHSRASSCRAHGALLLSTLVVSTMVLGTKMTPLSPAAGAAEPNTIARGQPGHACFWHQREFFPILSPRTFLRLYTSNRFIGMQGEITVRLRRPLARERFVDI